MVAGSSSAGKGWDDLCRQYKPAADEAWVAISSDPRRHSSRQHRLKGELGTTQVDGVTVEQWQYEATSGARVRYAIDDDNHKVVLTDAGTGHPKDSERVKGRRR